MTSPNGLEDAKSKVRKTISKKDFTKLVGEKFGASVLFKGEAGISQDEKKVLEKKFKKSVLKEAEKHLKSKLFVALKQVEGQPITDELLGQLNVAVGKHQLTADDLNAPTPRELKMSFSPVKPLPDLENDTVPPTTPSHKNLPPLDNATPADVNVVVVGADDNMDENDL